MSRRKTKPSQTALLTDDFQRLLPEARLVYLSATTATEAHNLGYFAERLGLCGPGTPFANRIKFVTEVAAAGIGGMELVARDMAQLGVYIARNLSFAGVGYDRLEHPLTPQQEIMYNTSARAWQIILGDIEKALEFTSSYIDPESGRRVIDKKAKAAAMSAFRGSQQRYFNTLLTAMKMPTVLADIKQQLAAGNCCVLQLVNTYEAALDRQIAKLGPDDDLSDIDLTPRDQIVQLLQHCFPIIQLERKQDMGGQFRMVPVVKNGQQVVNKQSVAMRDRLVAQVASIRVPEGPLEMLINHFGADQVAEVTGRKRRVVRNADGNTIIEVRSQARCIRDVRAFMDDEKRILVFSDAGGTGASYHADPRCLNKRRRIHYLAQPGWVADAAIQGFGRTHRSMQVCAPFYRLVVTSVPGERRFVSTICRRLDQLGAITRGERKAVGNGLFSAADNLESPYASAALKQLITDIFNQKIPDLSITEFEKMTGLRLTTN